MKKMASLLKDDGRIINFAAGFWKAPIGADHCDDFMRFPVPWTQLAFSDQARFAVRREKVQAQRSREVVARHPRRSVHVHLLRVQGGDP